MKRWFASIAVCALLAPTAPAHFIWIVPDEKGGSAQVVFSDTLAPDSPDLLARIAKTDVYLRTADDKTTAVKWTQAKDAYQLTLDGKGDRTLGAVCTYGVVQRGSSEPFLLKYHAKAFVGWPLEAAARGPVLAHWDRLALEIRSTRAAGLSRPSDTVECVCKSHLGIRLRRPPALPRNLDESRSRPCCSSGRSRVFSGAAP